MQVPLENLSGSRQVSISDYMGWTLELLAKHVNDLGEAVSGETGVKYLLSGIVQILNVGCRLSEKF